MEDPLLSSPLLPDELLADHPDRSTLSTCRVLMRPDGLLKAIWEPGRAPAAESASVKSLTLNMSCHADGTSEE